MIRQVQLDEMKTRKLLEHAAKAAGYDTSHEWNPLEDDGEALKLAIKLNLSIRFKSGCVFVFKEDVYGEEYGELAASVFTKGCEKSKLTRLAIVNAAAWLGGYRER